MAKGNTKDMTQGEPFKLILFFSVPLLIGNIFQQLYSMVDTIIVGTLSIWGQNGGKMTDKNIILKAKKKLITLLLIYLGIALIFIGISLFMVLSTKKGTFNW